MGGKSTLRSQPQFQTIPEKIHGQSAPQSRRALKTTIWPSANKKSGPDLPLSGTFGQYGGAAGRDYGQSRITTFGPPGRPSNCLAKSSFPNNNSFSNSISAMTRTTSSAIGDRGENEAGMTIENDT
jgi:hypothetical protein